MVQLFVHLFLYQSVAIRLTAIASIHASLLTGLLPNITRESPANLKDEFSDKISQTLPGTNNSVSEIAKRVTVRVLANNGAGSGVIINRQGQTYTVLTCDHVLAERDDNNYTILTSDGRTYPARRLPSPQFGDKDLALVQFISEQSYQVVAMGNSNVSIGEDVYAAGFPNWHWVNPKAIEDTRNWGTRAFRLTKGNVGMIADRSLPRGYQLGYTNEIENGMSGGPVLDSNGRLIGINGRLKFPPQGIGVYRFADGTMPSPALFQRMEALSWAIPIAAFRQML